jgi:hypothetical protein
MYTPAVSYEFITRLPSRKDEIRWLVREVSSDVLRVVWTVDDSDPAWLQEVEQMTTSWIAFTHPRVARVHAMAWLGGRLVVKVDDDRGPAFHQAAAVLADTPVECEGWAVAQLITIADGLTAMAAHQPGFIHRRLDLERMFIDATGHARLRAPIERVSLGPMRNRVGRCKLLTDLGFLSPEQCRGLSLTPASDVFALAANLVTALSGRPPFTEGSEFRTLEAVIRHPPRPCTTYAPGLDRVLARAFAKQPAERYPDPAAFAAELYECVPEAGDYDAVVSDRIAAWWPTAGQLPAVAPRDPACTKRWDELDAGDDEAIRHCTSCQQPVVHVRSVEAAVPLLGRRCVAFQPN